MGLTLIATLFVLAVYIFLFLPMIVLVVMAFNSAPRGVAWQGFTTDWFVKLFQNDAILEALTHSLEVAISASLLSAVFGVSIAITINRGKGKGTKWLGSISQIPLMIPEVVQGLSLLVLFVWLTIPLGLVSVILAHTAFGSAYVATIVRSRLVNLDPMLEEAAADLGARPSKIFWGIVFPQLTAAIVSGMLMVFTLSFDDFIVAFFTAGVGATTLPLKIYSMLKFGITPEVNALSALILLVSLGLVTLAFWTQQQGSLEKSKTL